MKRKLEVTVIAGHHLSFIGNMRSVENCAFRMALFPRLYTVVDIEKIIMTTVVVSLRWS